MSLRDDDVGPILSALRRAGAGPDEGRVPVSAPPALPDPFHPGDALLAIEDALLDRRASCPDVDEAWEAAWIGCLVTDPDRILAAERAFLRMLSSWPRQLRSPLPLGA